MQTPQSALSYYQHQQQIAAATVGLAKKHWQGMTDDFSSSWAQVAPAMLESVQLGRAAVVASSAGYTSAVLAETNQVAPQFGVLNPQAFLSQAPNGQPMADVLAGVVVQAKVAVKSGATPTEALAQAERWLTGVLLTVMADTGRSVVGVDIAQRPGLSGYVRMLNAPSCSRCVILAGKWFRWNAGFQRHPRCDCRHIPASEDVGGDFRTDPYAYFNSLSEAKQNKMFKPTASSREGKQLAKLNDKYTLNERLRLAAQSNARAIRKGGDIYRIENIRMRGLGTAKSLRIFGTPARATPDQIFRVAGTRTRAIQMLTEEGYITGPQVTGGNIIGNYREGFGQLGKGGKARAASDAVALARQTGVRDPLNRYTMTAAERQLYDAHYMLNYSLTHGTIAPSIGANTADKYSQLKLATPKDIASQRAWLAKQVAKLPDQPESVRRLAKLLGL